MNNSADFSRAFQPPDAYASRSPCPALNALANHSYLPRDGRNITIADLENALQLPETYKLSVQLAKFLVAGGLAMMHKAPTGSISLHDLARHGYIEHDASLVHKNTATGNTFAPVECDSKLLEALLDGREYLTVDAVAERRVVVEQASKYSVGLMHQEIARGEWALVLGIFGRAHGGKVPADLLRVWLGENRFPQGWQSTHEQGLSETLKISQALHMKMYEYRTRHRSAMDNGEETDEVQRLAKDLTGSLDSE